MDNPTPDRNSFQNLSTDKAKGLGNVPTRVNLLACIRYEGRRLERLNSVMQAIEKTINSTAFRRQVLEFRYRGQYSFYYRRNLLGRYIDKPYTNAQVYEIIMDAQELVKEDPEPTIDLYLELVIGSNGSVIGYGNPGSKEIYTYSEMFDQMEIDELANHYVHEWCHKIGFDHSYLPTAKRNSSVPYAIGNIIETLLDGNPSHIE
ncbi:hypothetical protein [Flavobacterium sp.]|uniref:hypothetical protein n=1 Tax=Flavobacterium sp. TaxID=239 RepID=UPI0039E4A032